MGLQDIQIKLDNPWGTYYAGSNVSGQLVLKLDSPKMVKCKLNKFGPHEKKR